MIRILHIVTDMNRGGLETMLMNYYRNIDRERVQFDFLTHRQYEGDYGAEIKEMGGNIYHLPRLNPFSHKYITSLNKFFSEHSEYTIVHVHQDCMSSILLKAAKDADIPVRIAHSHNSAQEHNIKYPIKLYYRNQISKHATHLMACSKKAGDWMFRGENYSVVENAIDMDKFEFDEILREKVRNEFNFGNDFVIGHVGRFSEVKNHGFLIDIFESLNKKRPSRLIMIGEGKLRARIEKKVDSMGLSDRTVFAGNRDDVAELMQAMDAFAFPSFFEGLPLSLIEAQTSGLPCYVSDKVSEESTISERVTRLSISGGIDEWVEELLKVDTSNRFHMPVRIKDMRYNIKIKAKELQNFYMSFTL